MCENRIFHSWGLWIYKYIENSPYMCKMRVCNRCENAQIKDIVKVKP